MPVDGELNRTFSIPDLGISENVRISPHRSLAEKAGLRWGRHVGLILNDHDANLYMRRAWGTCAALTAVEATAERVALHAEWLAWNGAVDDVAENAHNDPHRWRIVANGMAECLSARVHKRMSFDLFPDPVVRAFDNLISRTLPLGTPDWRTRFIAVFSQLLEGLAVEQDFKNSQSTPDVITYTHVRRNTGYMPLLYCLQEVILGAEVSPEIIGSQVYQRMVNASIDAIDFINDVYSLEKEVSRGETFNVVVALSHEHKIDLDLALNRSAGMIRNCVAEFRMTERELLPILDAKKIHGKKRRDLATNVAGMYDWIAGLIQWYRSSSRYIDLTDYGT